VRVSLKQPPRSVCESVFAAAAIAIVLGLGGPGWFGCSPSPSAESPRVQRRGPVTFNRDVAPILFAHCAPCHRPGQSAPFSLLSFAEAQKHAADIVKVTQTRYMPPWLPEPGYGEFIGERRLSAKQIEIIQSWASEGSAEGAAADLPPPPKWTEGWQLGQPDLVLQMSPSYPLGPDGRDVYRNFVIPNPLNETRYVQAVEFHPGNRSVHHVRILIDQAGQSQRLDDQDPEPGFDGMRPPAKFPVGHMVTWVPGKVPAPEPEGLPWVLEKDTDLVLQIHMQRTGKPELLQPTLGLHFTNRAPTRPALVIGLLSELIDIPAGEKNYVVERTFELPVEVQVLSVLPHLHYLGKEVQGFATLPDGTKTWLLWIKHWDFNWQGEYRYRQPVFLPKATVLTMRYTYDNSDENVRNPNHPPRDVSFGPQSTDEMAELWLQVLPRNVNDLAILRREKQRMDSRETAAFYEKFLHAHPKDAPAHVGLGKVLGPLGDTAAAEKHFRTALELNARQPEAHYYLGLLLFDAQKFSQARMEFEAELQNDPAYYKAHVGLGMIAIEEDKLDQAETHVRAALLLNPKDAGVQQMLTRIVTANTGAKP
jgi:tetratricopeptide repeat protein